MKAILCPKYGPPEVLEVVDLEKPIPEDNEVLIKNHGSSINTVDVISRGGKAPSISFWEARKLLGPLLRLTFGGLRRPKQKIPGYSFAGEIEAIGKEVKNWKVGDQVMGYSPGACAEYMTVPAHRLAKKPTTLTLLETSAVPGGAPPALLAFRDLQKPEKGQKVLIIGASGGIGSYGVQIAKIYGAEVTGVCSTSNLELIKSIGADNVIDYTKEDYTKSEKKYDIIFDAIGKNKLSSCKKILTKNGVYVSNNFLNSRRHLLQALTNGLRRKKLKFGIADESADNLNQLREWIEDGKLKPVIDTVYPLEKTSDAHKHYETGHSKGRVVISIV